MANNQGTEIPILSVSKFNATGGTLAEGTLVKLDSTAGQVVQATASTDVIFGVVRKAIADQTWGDILVLGRARVLAGGTLGTIGTRITATTGGKAAAIGAVAGTNYSFIGLSEMVGTTDTLFDVILTGPGSVFQAA